MASPSTTQHEPTMEEILASIRKIISEDSTEPHAQKQDADVLELTPTQEVREEPRPVAPAPPPPPMSAPPAPPVAPQKVAAPEPQAAENDVVFMSNEETAVSSPARSEPQEHEGILSDKARKAIDDAFSSLDQVEVRRKETPRPTFNAASVEGNSVEAVFERAVRSAIEPLLNQWMDSRKEDLLGSIRPMIRDWMDEHFPAILEGAVREEVARVLKARGSR